MLSGVDFGHDELNAQIGIYCKNTFYALLVLPCLRLLKLLAKEVIPSFRFSNRMGDG